MKGATNVCMFADNGEIVVYTIKQKVKTETKE